MKGICDMEKIESIINDVVRNYELDCEKVDDKNYDIMFSHYLDYYSNLVPVDTRVFNKKGYHRFEKEMDSLVEKHDGYTFYVSYDVSGYEYWTIDMEESNYIAITVLIEEEVINYESLEKDLDNYISKVDNKYCHLLGCDSYLRKVE